ncbi:hypothetical protein ZWY2020_022884 [Hordeum vulgare]|nr:hypothetical protein ZWY2020_022884 [Hordeum vulgare]
MTVDLSMAEICSSFPTSGDLYYWSARLSGNRWSPFASWITGWFNIVGQWAVTTSVDFSLTQLIQVIILLSTGGSKGGMYLASKYVVIAFHATILLSHVIINSLPISWLSFFGQFCGCLEHARSISMASGGHGRSMKQAFLYRIEHSSEHLNGQWWSDRSMKQAFLYRIEHSRAKVTPNCCSCSLVKKVFYDFFVQQYATTKIVLGVMEIRLRRHRSMLVATNCRTKNEDPVVEIKEDSSYEKEKVESPISLSVGLWRRSMALVEAGTSNQERNERNAGAPVKLDAKARDHIEKHRNLKNG